MVREFIEQNKISIFVKELHCDLPVELHKNLKRQRRYGCLLSRENRQIAVYLSFGTHDGQLTVEKILCILALDAYLAENRIDCKLASNGGSTICDEHYNQSDTVRGSEGSPSRRTKRARRLRGFLGRNAYKELLTLAEEELMHAG